MGDGKEHVSERFARLLALYRRPDGREWGGQDLEDATGGTVTRSYVANLKKGRIESPGLAKLEAISGAMGFSPALWFGGKGVGPSTGSWWQLLRTRRSGQCWRKPRGSGGRTGGCCWA